MLYRDCLLTTASFILQAKTGACTPMWCVIIAQLSCHTLNHFAEYGVILAMDRKSPDSEEEEKTELVKLQDLRHSEFHITFQMRALAPYIYTPSREMKQMRNWQPLKVMAPGLITLKPASLKMNLYVVSTKGGYCYIDISAAGWYEWASASHPVLHSIYFPLLTNLKSLPIQLTLFGLVPHHY